MPAVPSPRQPSQIDSIMTRSSLLFSVSHQLQLVSIQNCLHTPQHSSCAQKLLIMARLHDMGQFHNHFRGAFFILDSPDTPGEIQQSCFVEESSPITRLTLHADNAYIPELHTFCVNCIKPVMLSMCDGGQRRTYQRCDHDHCL
jgi:hypothetical protein